MEPGGAAGQGGAMVLRCRASGQGEVTIRLDGRRCEGRTLSCISGFFAVDLSSGLGTLAWPGLGDVVFACRAGAR